MIMLRFQPVDTHHDLKWHRLGSFSAQFDDAIGKETVGGDVHAQGLEVPMGQANDLKQVGSYEGFASRQTHRIHTWQLAVDIFDFVEFQISLA